METKDIPSLTAAGAKLPNFIAANLKLLRRSAAWSQTELATRVGLNRGNIASYESGNAEPSICNLLRIGNLFNVTTRDLTRRDLSDDTELALARSAHDLETDERDGRYADQRASRAELQQLIASAHQLYQHKVSRMDNPCREAGILSAHYLQLYELTECLLAEHSKLLDGLDCHCR